MLFDDDFESLDKLYTQLKSKLDKKINIWFHETSFHLKTHFPDCDRGDIVILGIREKEAEKNIYDTLRTHLYSLYLPAQHQRRLIDLGDTLMNKQKLSSIYTFLIDKGVTPIFITPSFYLAYDMIQPTSISVGSGVHFLNIKSQLKMETDVGHIIRHTRSYTLRQYLHLAYQSYLCDKNLWYYLNDKDVPYQAKRLGQVRDNLSDIEATIRSANLINFDLSSINSFYCPATTEPKIFGLTGEEACQIMWYAGLNQDIKTVFISGYDHKKTDGIVQTSEVAATIIWYFIEGLHARESTHNIQTADFKKYTIVNKETEEEQVFYRNKITSAWWLIYGDNEHFVQLPCTYEDYVAAKDEHHSARWKVAKKIYDTLNIQ